MYFFQTKNKKAHKIPKGVQAIFVQKYCHYCLEKLGTNQANAKHTTKCHKCKAKNLALLLPYSNPCKICSQSKIYSQATIHTLSQSPENGLKCPLIKAAADTIEQTLDTMFLNLLKEVCNFVDKNISVMISDQNSCYKVSTDINFNNHVYAYSRLLEVVRLFLKHSHTVVRKQILISQIASLRKKTARLMYFYKNNNN